MADVEQIEIRYALGRRRRIRYESELDLGRLRRMIGALVRREPRDVGKGERGRREGDDEARYEHYFNRR